MPIPSIKSILSISVYKIYPRLSRLKKLPIPLIYINYPLFLKNNR